MFAKHYTPEQLQQLKARREALGEAAIRQVEAEWPQRIARVLAELDKGTGPTSEPVRVLAGAGDGLHGGATPESKKR